jgi:hypothetical protein
MKNLKTFEEYLNESLNEGRSSYTPWNEYVNLVTSEWTDLGEDQAAIKKFFDAFTKVVEGHFKTKSNNIVVDMDMEEMYEGDYDNLKQVAEIEGKKFGLDSDTIDYIGVESDENGDLWMTPYDVQRGEMTLICKKR